LHAGDSPDGQRTMKMNEMVCTERAWAYRYRGRATNPLILQLETEARLKRWDLWSSRAC
jgi:hypothetical protein